MSTVEIESLLQDAFTQLETLRNLLNMAYSGEDHEIDVLQNITERINLLSGDIDINYDSNTPGD